MISFENISISAIRSGKGECIHLRFIGSSGTPHNIIIDSGPSSTAGEFRKLLEDILSRNEILDMLFVTHYDDDHIGGILKVGDHGFQEVYFNAYDGEEETGNLSASQAQRLFITLPSAKVYSKIVRGDIIELDGAKITVIAPSQENLSGAIEKMKDVQLAAVSDWNDTLDELIGKQYPPCDSSVSNRASVVFIFEFGSISLLLCGDAPDDSILDGLEKRSHFDLVKLPHHGSSRNVSDKMLEMIDADTFLICADGTSHPNKQTIAKLLKHYKTVTVYSNYNWWMNGFLKPEDFKYIDHGLNFKLI